MEVNEVPFCNQFAYNLKNNKEKEIIIKKIQKKFNIDILKKNFVYSTKLDKLINNNKYLLSCITQGNRYYLYLTTFNNENYTLLIDKKITENHKFPKIIIIDLNFSENLFENTLFEGELIKKKNNEWIFLIDDIKVYKNNLVNLNFSKKINLLYEIINNLKYDSFINTFKVNIKKFFNIKDLETIFDNYIPNCDFRINGLIFYPEESNKNLPVIDFSFNRKNIQNNITENIEKKNVQKINKSNNLFIFEIRKSNLAGIFTLFCFKDKELKKYSIARIDTLECSEFVNNLLKDKDSEIVECIYNKNFKKWIPIKKSKEFITDYNFIEKYISINN